MNCRLVFIAASLILTACRSTATGRALPKAPGTELDQHRLVGCEEKIRGPANPILRRYVGQTPIAYVSSHPGCEEIDNCRSSYEFAVFADGLFVHEGATCGGRRPRVVMRHLDSRKLAETLDRVERCSHLSSSQYWCSHGDRLAVECRTQSGSLRVVDACSRPGNALQIFADGLRQALDVDGIITDANSCDEDDAGLASRTTEHIPAGADTKAVDLGMGDLGLTVHPARKTECTYVPQ